MTNIETTTLITAIVGAATGITGVVLGVINTCHQISQNRIRLKVTPKLAYMIDANNYMTIDRNGGRLSDYHKKGIPSRLCIEVTNLSAFAVTISDVGFGDTKKLRQFFYQPELSPGKTWPTRLDSRESVVAYAKMGAELDPSVLGKARAYAKTDCGHICYGTSPIFKEYVHELRINDKCTEEEN